MKVAAGSRELITVATGTSTLQGTYHEASGGGNESRIGILFSNAGFLPRAGTGDNAVYWAESFARRGYPCFRLDLPGLGDSPGDLPVKLLDFVDLVNSAHYAPLLVAAAQNLSKRFDLTGMVLFGHCAGTVSAVYAAGASREIKGLILLDPYFHRQQQSSTIRTKFRVWVPQNPVAGMLSKAYDRLKYLKSLTRKNEFPDNANSALIRCWHQVASAGVPMIVFTAPPPNPRLGEFNYLQKLQRKSGRIYRVEVNAVEGTNHSFVRGPGREAVRKKTEQWLEVNFPPVKSQPGRVIGQEHTN